MTIEIIKSKVPILISDSHRYITDKGVISLVLPCPATSGNYEIYCIKSEMFDGIERYNTLEGTEERINELLL